MTVNSAGTLGTHWRGQDPGSWLALLPADGLPADVLCQGLQGAAELDSDSSQAPQSLQLFLLRPLGSLGVLPGHQASIKRGGAHPNSPHSSDFSDSPDFLNKNALKCFFGYPGSAQGCIANITPTLFSTCQRQTALGISQGDSDVSSLY